MLRAPKRPLVPLPHTLSEITGPVYGHGEGRSAGPTTSTRQHEGEPLGERIIVHGRVMDTHGRPLPTMPSWRSGRPTRPGRYRHDADNHPAPLDPNFSGGGRCATDADGRYRFVTIKPAAYPWGNDPNAWRPAHIHFSLFGTAFVTRLITQMYFPGDPLLDCDPIFNSTADAGARQRLVCRLDLEKTQPEWALAYEFDIVLRGRDATPMEG